MTFYNPTVYDRTYLLHFLSLALLVGRLTPQPHTHECHPPSNRDPHTGNPDPTSTDLPATWPFVVSEMPDCYFSFYVHVGEERSLVVDAEGKDAMLVRQSEGTAENSAIKCLRCGYKIETMIGRKHSEFKLQSI